VQPWTHSAPRLPWLHNIVIRAGAAKVIDGVGQQHQGVDAEDEDAKETTTLSVITHGKGC